MAILEGSFRLQFLFELGEEIRLDQLRSLLTVEKPAREPSFRHQAPDYVRFERPPLEQRVAAVKLATGEHFAARMRYFDYGVVCLELELPFRCDWDELIALAAKWVSADVLEGAAEETMRRHKDQILAAIPRPAERLLTEDYTVIELRRATGDDGEALTAAHLLDRYGREIARIVRGESSILSDGETHEVLASHMSYSPTDLLVVGYAAALVYDQDAESALPMIQLLEYANTQLLDFRYYDEILTKVLADTHSRLSRRPRMWQRWRMAREAEQLNALRLEITELAERADNAIKFLSDMFHARAYKLASTKIGVPDYRNLVDEKLRTAGEMYRFLMDEFHHGRAFVLESAVVIILIIDLIHLFFGKKTL